jgi:putative heme-binding domain-containing protein
LVETQPDFITCDDGWFRPVDLAVGPDGALYVADFYNCIIGHYEVPLEHPRRDRTHGRVWRVIYTGTGGQENGHNRPPLPMPDLAKLTTDQIVRLLGDANLIVRKLATNWLVDIGQTSSAADVGKHRLAACSSIRATINHTDSSPELRSHGLWVLERLGDMTTADVQRFAADESPQVRTHLIRALAEREPWTSNDYAQVRTAITDGNATVRRVAADALGRHPQPDNLLLLFNLLAETPPEDTHLVHVARMALRDHLRETATLSHVRSSQIGRSQLQTLVELAASVKTPDVAELALDYLERFGTADPKAADYVAFAAQFLKQDRIAALIQIVRGQSNKPASEFSGLQSIQTGLERRGMRDNPDATVWARQLTDQLLASGQTSVDGRADQFRAGPAARELIARFRLAEYQPRLEQVVRSRESDLATRRQAAETLLTFSPDARLSALLGTLSSANPDTLNVNALNEHILQATLSREDASIAEALAETMLRAPRDVQRQLAETLAGDRAGGNALLQLAEAGKASPRLLLDPAVQNLLNALKLERLDERIAALTSRLPAENEQLLRLIDQRRQQFASAGASAELGRGVFEKHCAACHQIAGKGENVGPQLDGIGGRGLARLIEDVLDPNRNVDPAFRTTTLVLADGRILSGLVRRVEAAAIVLADDKGKELTIAKSDIDEQQLTVLSLMPAGFGESLPADDFQHLMAFLLTHSAQTSTSAESPSSSRSVRYFDQSDS